MLLPSPIQATVLPRMLPRCSTQVCMSASSWQGWKSSVRALITGTRECAAKRCTISCARRCGSSRCRPSRTARARVSSTGSPRPSWVSLRRQEHARGHRAAPCRLRRRRGCGSRTSRRSCPVTRFGAIVPVGPRPAGRPSSRWRAAIRCSSSRGLRSSRVRKCLAVMARSSGEGCAGSGGAWAPPAWAAISAASVSMIWSTSAAWMTSGGSRRITLSAVTLISRPCSSAACTRWPQGSRSSMPTISPRPRISTTPGVPARRACSPRTRRSPMRVGVGAEIVGDEGVEHAERRSADERIAAEGGAVVAGVEHRGGLAARQAGADRHAIAETLRGGHHVGQDRRVLVGEHLAGAAVAGLHFVQHQQPAVLVAQRAHAFEVTLGATRMPHSPWIGSTSTATMLLLLRAMLASASRSPKRRAHEAAHQRLEARLHLAVAGGARAWPACGRERHFPSR